LGPKFASLRAPFTLWIVDGEYSYDEALAATAPTYSEQREFNKAFEATVGEEYLRCVYKAEYIFLRLMFNACQRMWI
jgi:hypothetical protein